VSETFLRDLDESGIIRLGASVKPRHPRGEGHAEGRDPADPEEKLLRAIFGEKPATLRDASLICPRASRASWSVVKIFSRQGHREGRPGQGHRGEELELMEKNLQDEVRILYDEMKKRAAQILVGQTLRSTSTTTTAARRS